MDSNGPNGDYSKSSGDEDSDTAGTGRSYECVFCRRGFTTAQALGGHMNIHRKDRAKNRPHASSISSSSPPISDRNFNYASFKSFAPVQSYPSYAMASSDHEVHVNYQTFFSSSAWDHHHHHSQRSLHTNNQQHFEMFGDEIWRGNNHGPSSHVAADHHHHHHPYDKEKREAVVSEEDEEEEEEEEEEDGLDLELRLGHDP